MRVAVICTDKPGHLQTRLDTRAAHKAFLDASPELEQAGPLLDDAGEMCGSLLIIQVEDMAAAQAWVDADPYAKAGLFAEVRLQAWNRVIG